MIHPTAIIDPQAKIAADVSIGPYCVVDGPVTVGAGCVLQPFSRLIGPLTLGARNMVHSNAVLGDWPQDRKFHGEFSETVIGDDNIFREGVTVHRGTAPGTRTVIGSRCYFMVNSHVGHNCVLGDDVFLINGALLGGHVHIADRAIVGGNCAMHQFTRVGRLAMISNSSSHNVDIPPFCIAMTTNTVIQLNAVGLRRAGVPRENITNLRRFLRLLKEKGRVVRSYLDQVPSDLLVVPEVREFVEFCRDSKRGVARMGGWSDTRSRNGADNGGED